MCKSLSVCVLVLINLVVFILGLAVTIFGALAQWGLNFFSDTIVPFIAKVISTSGAGPNIQVSFKDIASIMGQYITYLGSAGLAIFILGLILMAMSLCGLCGACKKSKILLIIYIVLLVILLLAMVALTLTIRFARDDLEKKGREVMNKYIIEEFKGLDPNSTNTESAILSLIQARVGCCGVDNGSDFENAKKWKKEYVYNGNAVNLTYPISCCKMKKGSYDVEDTKCFDQPNTSNSNAHIGCYKKLWQMVKDFSWFVIYGLIGLDVFLLLLIIMSVIIIRSVSQDDMKNV